MLPTISGGTTIPEYSNLLMIMGKCTLKAADEMQGESNSITNQKQLLESYARKNGFVTSYHYTDDGVRETTFD